MDSTLVQLIKQYETYKMELKNHVNEDTLTDFIIYLNSKMGEMDLDETRLGTEAWKNFNRKTMEEIAVSTLGRMGRFADHYSRKVIPQTELGSIEEFTYLIHLMQTESLTKTELIHGNLHAITSGTEIIKRLLKKGFITQFNDEQDKRSIRVKISVSGRTALMGAFEKLGMITEMVSARLNNGELIQLVNLLKKLDDFHMQVFKESRNLPMSEILQKHVHNN